MWTTSNRCQSCGELTDVSGVIVLLNMLTTSGNGDAIKHLKEVKTQAFEQAFCGTFFGWQLRPTIILCLCLAENIVYTAACIEQTVNVVRVTLVGQSYLVLQIIETVIYWCSREHQHFSLYSLADNLIEQL